VSINASYLESYTERLFTSYVASKNGFCVKMEKRHWPDRLIVIPGGHCFFIEFKRKGEVPRKAQTLMHQRLRAINHKVYVCDNYDDAVRVYENECEKNERI
jgi:hypothetical protein